MKPPGPVRFVIIALASAWAVACSDEVPGGIRNRVAEGWPDSLGTHVRYDLSRGPFSVPWPNDTLCWQSASTGEPCWPNFAVTGLDRITAKWVEAINATRGWSPASTVVIPIERDPSLPPGPAIDLARLLKVQSDNDWSNDAIYVIDLETGVPVSLDFPTSRGNFVLHDPVALDGADARKSETSLSVETVDERYDTLGGASVVTRTTTGDRSGAPIYRPEWDTDSDGILDVPVLLPSHPLCNNAPSERDANGSNEQHDRCLADGLVDAYEAATDTLRVQLRAPLLEHHQYAVVTTDRLLDSKGRDIASPFPSVSHPVQQAAMTKLMNAARQPEVFAYYGDKAEALAQHARFVWTFTTSAPVFELDALYRRTKTLQQANGRAETTEQKPSIIFAREHDFDRDCPTGLPRAAIAAMLREKLALTPSQERAVTDAYASVARIVTGTWTGSTLGSATFGKPSDVRASASSLPVWLTLPNAALASSPIPLVIVSHEQFGSRLDGLRWAGQWARLGLATLGFERAGGSDALAPGRLESLTREFPATCTKALLLDIVGDVSSELEGASVSDDLDIDIIATSNRWRAGAFDLATIVDSLRGEVRTSLDAGTSLTLEPRAMLGVGAGAAIAAMAATLVKDAVTLVMVDPAVSPDQAWRRAATWGRTEAQLWQLFGPRLSGVPVADLESNMTSCVATEASLRLVSTDDPGVGREVGCLPVITPNGAKFPDGATVIATNLSTLARRCVGMTSRGQFSLGLPARASDAIELAIYDSMEAVVRFGRDAACELTDANIKPTFVLGDDPNPEVDSSLITTAGGLGLERQSSEFAQVLDWAASAFSLANPSSFVAQLAQPKTMTDAGGLLLSVAPGNSRFPPDGGLLLARAAHLVPRFVPDNLKRFPAAAADTTPTSLSLALPRPTAALSVEWAHLDEGVPRLQRFPPDASPCGTNVTFAPEFASLCHRPCVDKQDCFGNMECAADSTCQMPVPSPQICQQSLPDMDALADDAAGFGVFRAVPFLRLTRYAGALQAGNADELWAPQSRHVGRFVEPTHPDWPLVALALPLADPLGTHGIPPDDLCQRFRFGNYLPYLFGRFMLTNGRDYPPVTDRDAQICLENPSANKLCKYVPAIN